MSPNRKADLQRKLAMAPIPKPPAGLAERIKSDIPQHLLVDVRKERERLSRSILFNLRVAASVILLIGSAYLALHILSRAEREAASKGEAPPNVILAQKAKPAPIAPARAAETAPPPELQKPAPVIVAEAKTEPLAKKEETRRRDNEAAPGGSATGMAAPAAVPPAPAPPPPVSAPMPQPATVADAATAAQRAAPPVAKVTSGGFVPSAVAESIALEPSVLFDIAIPRVGAPLEGAALIQHFAAPAAPPRALRVDVEATMFDDKALLRFSVDTPEVAHVDGGSRPPVGASPSLDIVFDDDLVVSRRALAGTNHSSDTALPSGTSVTALFEVELKPDVDRRATIATVTLRYRSVADGEEHVVTKKLRRSDIRDWKKASQRMKGATLGAALVYGIEPPEKIAEKARAAGLSELAEVAGKR